MPKPGRPPRSTVHIVVTCANRKRYPVPARLHLGDLQERRQGLRFAAWTRRLGADEPSIRATDLYGGEHWQIARGLPATVGESARLWICSAGYGLVAADTCLHPYAATFSPGDPDSAGETSAHARDWWRRLSDWAGPEIGSPRSFADLAQRDPSATVVAVLSEAYVRACSDDLRVATRHLDDPDRFVVIGPATGDEDIDDLLVPVTARLRTLVGGSLQALHARVATHLLTTTEAHHKTISRVRLRHAARQANAAAPPDPSRRAAGIRLCDEEVRDFIRVELTTGPASATGLLRRLRQSGHSCEQSRFKQLFADSVAAGAVE